MPEDRSGLRLGILNGLISSATFGTIPLFTLPLLVAGISVQTTLVYRFGIAALAMGALLLAKRANILIGAKALLKITVISLFYMAAVVLYFHGLRYLPGGTVATLLFQYPVMVALIMVLFFHEKFRWKIALAIALAVTGVALLSLNPVNEVSRTITAGGALTGVLLCLLSALSNSLYVVGIQIARLPKMNGIVMNFYVMLIGAIFCLLNALFVGELVWLDSARNLAIATLLALVTAVVSNLTLIFAVRRIGSTLTSILGVLEPLTAVVIGCVVFGEPFTSRLAVGTLLIIVAVLIVLLGPKEKSGAPGKS